MDPFKKHFEDSINDPSNTNNFDVSNISISIKTSSCLPIYKTMRCDELLTRNETEWEI